jgi:hypothetical protein
MQFLWREAVETRGVCGTIRVQYGDNCASQMDGKVDDEGVVGSLCGLHLTVTLSRLRNKSISVSGTTEEATLMKLSLK